VYVTRAWSGDKINGFAIDPITLEILITTRFGTHHMATQLLANRIEHIEALRQRKHWCDLKEKERNKCLWRLIAGLIFSEIKGFSTPILQLFTHDAEPEAMREVMRWLKKQQKFLPVRGDGRLLED
jgi:hypothetical protein